MKKKILALALCLTLIFTLGACGGGNNDGGSADSSGSTTVVVAMGGGFTSLDPGYVYE